MTNNDFYTKEFFSGQISISRGELESLPCPFCTKEVTDEQMQQIINITCNALKDRMELSDDEEPDWEEERISEIWWEELEETVNIFDIPYYEDMDE